MALFTTKPIADVRSIAMDTSSRTSVALVRVLCARHFKIQPAIESRGPDVDDMLAHCDAALIIGDNALFLKREARSRLEARGSASDQRPATSNHSSVDKIDLGDEWTRMTGLPFVWAFWAGRPGVLCPADVVALQRARDEGVLRPDELAREYLADAPERQQAGADYLRGNIKYYLRDDERAGLEAFYRYAVEAGVVEAAKPLEFYGQP